MINSNSRIKLVLKYFMHKMLSLIHTISKTFASLCAICWWVDDVLNVTCLWGFCSSVCVVSAAVCLRELFCQVMMQLVTFCQNITVLYLPMTDLVLDHNRTSIRLVCFVVGRNLNYVLGYVSHELTLLWYFHIKIMLNCWQKCHNRMELVMNVLRKH